MKKYRWSGTMFLAAFIAVVTVTTASGQDTVDVTGKWVFQVQTSAGSGSPTLDFKQEGEKLTGHYSGQLGEADLKGTVKGKTIEFSFTTSVQGYTIEAVYSGTLDAKDSMKGSVTLTGLGEGTFTGKKQTSL
jgi:hypothetical protein